MHILYIRYHNWYKQHYLGISNSHCCDANIKCNHYFDSCRERERQHKREELWTKVETLAQKSPAFESMANPKHSIEDYNNIANSPEDDGDVSIESFEHEAHEVTIY